MQVAYKSDTDGLYVIWHGIPHISRYPLIQHLCIEDNDHRIAPSFAELLEIPNPPDGETGVVIHIDMKWVGSRWHIFRTVETARAAFEVARVFFLCIDEPVPVAISSLDGYVCTESRRYYDHRPWFYAID